MPPMMKSIPFEASMLHFIWLVGSLLGQVMIGSIIAFAVALLFYFWSPHPSRTRLIAAVLFYYGVCFVCWIIGDIVCGPIRIFTEMPRY